MVECNEGVLFIEADADVSLSQLYPHSLIQTQQVKAIHQLFPCHQGCHNSAFEVLTAFIWRCRTIALQLELDKEVRLMCINNVRGKSNPPLLGLGYHGNSSTFPTVVTTVGKFCRNSFRDALDLVKKSKAMTMEEYIQSVADLMVIRGRPCFTTSRSWIVSDVTRVGFKDVDFG
ncbi:benzyl alcohol O-benzoyltransferase-like [Prosopis cineraria]|uniref:benzyl alcohol O-benzoyltransferase-like n=1 Tax=Prosopis cineraria TaxID=364024 RepID=UPI0024104915|nr:benzyl alcohol O-benzoyltransferase-like [Prosopis cineraria]